MKKLLLTILLLNSFSTFAQQDTATLGILKFQETLNTEYRDAKTSPLKGKALKKFKNHDFFPIDLQYHVEATLTRMTESSFFPMKTTSQVLKEYRIYGMLAFTLKGKKFEVPVYQSKMLMANEKYKNYLFFPFTDLTNGESSYGAGRYIDLRIPDGNKIILDFNKAYNPYCAYSDGYSCPIVPADNHLDVEVLAGVRYSDKKGKH
ncbi:MAG TPA: DUF1684 domain-containing protein [Cyclobacteriaceae bacterium]|nr:DUF1684 domain-containing protein [Cyclobacteriaceae bacterium]